MGNERSFGVAMRLVTMCVFFLVSTQTAPAETLDHTIDYLLTSVSTSDATFIRNGTSYTPAEAAAHIKAKYQHFKSDIKTPEDFIRLCASKSLVSGKSYLVRTPDGKEMTLSEWLTHALETHRHDSSK